jgi:hypothetical protein
MSIVQQVNGAAGTIQLKLGGGRVYSIVGVSIGTNYALQLKDGPDPAGNAKTIVGQNAAIPAVAGVQYMSPTQPTTFINGLQAVVTGTPGEFEVEFD